MADFWFAECLPCKWETRHTSQDAAIAAAEDHVFDQHRRVSNLDRAAQYIGHVQNRTENTAVHVSELPPPELPKQPIMHPGDGAANLTPVADTTEATKASPASEGAADTSPASDTTEATEVSPVKES